MTGFNSKRDAAAYKDALFEKFEVEQPAQEPVGTLNISRYKGHLVNHDFDYFGELPDGTYSVYTAPPQREWVGLTDEEIAGIRLKSFDSIATNRKVYEAIEAKLKEKNNGT
jgi:hypothetical protein